MNRPPARIATGSARLTFTRPSPTGTWRWKNTAVAIAIPTIRIRGIGIAFRGAYLLAKTESSIQIQLVIAVLVTLAGFYYNISNTEWILQRLAISLDLGVEGLNTAIEKMSDYTQPEFDNKIGFIKDVSAGAVMWVSIGAVITGLIIYIPKVF